jgi:hypothetical protein
MPLDVLVFRFKETSVFRRSSEVSSDHLAGFIVHLINMGFPKQEFTLCGGHN